MTTVRLWVVLGAGSVGKSTTVGHLAGDFGRGVNGLRRGRGGGMREIPLRGGGYLSIHPRRQSLQEARKSPDQALTIIKGERARLQRRAGLRLAFFNVLLTLRTDRVGNLPPAEDYLSLFVQQGWHIESLVLLSPKERDRRLYKRFGAAICYVNDSRTIDVLQLVGQVRNHFGWA